jgi:hypothetical protein
MQHFYKQQASCLKVLHVLLQYWKWWQVYCMVPQAALQCQGGHYNQEQLGYMVAPHHQHTPLHPSRL